MRTFDYFLAFSIIALFLLGTYIIIEQRDKEGRCVYEPLTYGVDLYSERADSELTCNCNFDSPNFSRFKVNLKGIEYLQDDLESYGHSVEINWSGLIQTIGGNTS